MKKTWDEYKSIVGQEVKDQSNFIYRGQSNESWLLKTSLHRTGKILTHDDLQVYFNNLVPEAQEKIEAWDGTKHDLSNSNDMAQFIAYLQHNGFPTPLLDWTFSPYIAAYFAFEGVNHFEPTSDHVAIYSFNQKLWAETYIQTYSYDEPKPHVTLLRPTYRGNHKQMLQQGIFWFTNSLEPELHVQAHEINDLKFLTKYLIPVSERQVVMKDLELMGVTAMQLVPGIESVCKSAFETICTRLAVGATPSEKASKETSLMPFLSGLPTKPEDNLINCPECNVKLNPKNLNKHLRNHHDK